MSYSANNEKVITEFEALVEKLEYGSLDTTFDIHNKRITAITVFGKQRKKYKNENLNAFQYLIKRITGSVGRKETTTLTFSVNLRNGLIDEILLLSKMTRKYEDSLKSVDKTENPL